MAIGLMSFHIVVRMHGTKTSSTKATVRIVTVTESNKRIICRVAARSYEFIKQKMNKEPKARTYIYFTGLFIDRLFYLFIIVFFCLQSCEKWFLLPWPSSYTRIRLLINQSSLGGLVSRLLPYFYHR